ncbi:diguanylate cyclase domain-containing protein [Bathymodiolus japonicus methanotrophic gill symbiont]|uniref:diguanylate cyclase domain-containing protein n=1 Tax=Bathymodiolus japonicus methanotrophic gill symbiont TaxID=113269 RepID=UPI003B831664
MHQHCVFQLLNNWETSADKLTNINNRMKLDQQLNDVMNLAQRYQHGFSIILIDR